MSCCFRCGFEESWWWCFNGLFWNHRIMSGKKYCLRVTLKASQLLSCPYEGKKIAVRLKWGKSRLWGGKRNETTCETCFDRKVLWDEDQNTFDYECKVYLENSMPKDTESLDRLFKCQSSLARLSISVSRYVQLKIVVSGVVLICAGPSGIRSFIWEISRIRSFWRWGRVSLGEGEK